MVKGADLRSAGFGLVGSNPTPYRYFIGFEKKIYITYKMAQDLQHFITDNFSTPRVITVLVHTYIATIIYEIINPIIFLMNDPDDRLKDFYIEITDEKKLNLGRVVSEFITICIILSVLYYFQKYENKM